jgi:Zn-dependent membrane protease YugP
MFKSILLLLAITALFCVPGFLVSRLLLHWHGIALIGSTIAFAAIALCVVFKVSHWQMKREDRNFVCGYYPAELREKEESWVKRNSLKPDHFS